MFRIFHIPYFSRRIYLSYSSSFLTIFIRHISHWLWPYLSVIFLIISIRIYPSYFHRIYTSYSPSFCDRIYPSYSSSYSSVLFLIISNRISHHFWPYLCHIPRLMWACLRVPVPRNRTVMIIYPPYFSSYISVIFGRHIPHYFWSYLRVPVPCNRTVMIAYSYLSYLSVIFPIISIVFGRHIPHHF